jgi:hypothetical protein
MTIILGRREYVAMVVYVYFKCFIFRTHIASVSTISVWAPPSRPAKSHLHAKCSTGGGAHPCGVVGVVQRGLPRASAIHGATMGVRTLIDLFYLWRRLYREPSPFRLRWRAPHFCYVSIYGKGPPSQGSISRLHEQEQTRCEK